MGATRIQAVCGFGCGSSLFLRIRLEEVIKANHIDAEVFCGDVGTCLSQHCDVIFISEELAARVQERATVPVVVIQNFMDANEVTEKALAFFRDPSSAP